MTAPLRAGDQPLPIPNDRRDVQSILIEDLCRTGSDPGLIEDFMARRELGFQRYGVALQPFNGRDVLRDAYEEVLDLAVYLRQALEEGFLLGGPYEVALGLAMRLRQEMVGQLFGEARDAPDRAQF